jgi:hypothetical protein
MRGRHREKQNDIIGWTHSSVGRRFGSLQARCDEEEDPNLTSIHAALSDCPARMRGFEETGGSCTSIGGDRWRHDDPWESK